MRQFAMRRAAAADSIRVNRQPPLVSRTHVPQRSTSPPIEGGWDFSRVPVRNDPSVRIQAKLTVGHSDDALEHEADRIAEQVMGMPEPGRPADVESGKSRNIGAAPSAIQTRSIGGGPHPGFEAPPPTAHEILSSSGVPLAAPVRAFFEPRFG
jgi:hypothetical protein